MPAGRPRSESSRRAVLDAAVDLLEEDGWAALSVERVAQRAGVGKQTIYRWWDGDLGQVVVEAYVDLSDERVPAIDTGSVRDDLLAVVRPVARMNARRDRGLPLANRALMAYAQQSEEFAERYRALHQHWREPMLEMVRRGVARAELRRGTDADLVVDLLLGLQWYRLLLGHRPTRVRDATASVDAALAPWWAETTSRP